MKKNMFSKPKKPATKNLFKARKLPSLEALMNKAKKGGMK